MRRLDRMKVPVYPVHEIEARAARMLQLQQEGKTFDEACTILARESGQSTVWPSGRQDERYVRAFDDAAAAARSAQGGSGSLLRIPSSR